MGDTSMKKEKEPYCEPLNAGLQGDDERRLLGKEDIWKRGQGRKEQTRTGV
jgi:hypothetical protein